MSLRDNPNCAASFNLPVPLHPMRNGSGIITETRVDNAHDPTAHKGVQPKVAGSSRSSSQPTEASLGRLQAHACHYMAFNPETGTTTQGESIEEALANLREDTTLYLEEFPAVIKGHPLVTMFTVPAHA